MFNKVTELSMFKNLNIIKKILFIGSLFALIALIKLIKLCVHFIDGLTMKEINEIIMSDVMSDEKYSDEELELIYSIISF